MRDYKSSNCVTSENDNFVISGFSAFETLLKETSKISPEKVKETGAEIKVSCRNIRTVLKTKQAQYANLSHKFVCYYFKVFETVFRFAVLLGYLDLRFLK